MHFAPWQGHIKFKGSFAFRDVFLKDPTVDAGYTGLNHVGG
jgi:hypothetical protein